MEAATFGLKAGEAWDLTEGWDFSRKDHLETAKEYQRVHKPSVLIGSPPCTPLSQLQTLNPNTEEAARKRAEGIEHMKFVISLYRAQLSEGRVFLHEHPSNATSWGIGEMKRLVRESGVSIYEADQCMFGLKTWGKHKSEWVLAKKPTKFLTNSRALGRD